ncbi:hypothetical protein Tco_1176500, partial [Tanacetum coccineum]
MTKNVKNEESDDEGKKGKNKEKQLTAEEAVYQEYLSKFLAFHARTTPVSLFSAIQNSNADMLRFLKDIGFSSLNNVAIDKLPMKLGRFVVSRFKNYKLSFDTGDQIEVTHSKIHDMLGIPVGGHSLFNLVERETGDEFVKKWAAQFSPKELKQIRVNDIARILLLYLDSTDFESLPVVRTRPAIKSWTSYLMKQRQELELKRHVVGLLPINSDWTKAEMEEAEGFIVFAENSEKE